MGFKYSILTIIGYILLPIATLYEVKVRLYYKVSEILQDKHGENLEKWIQTFNHNLNDKPVNLLNTKKD